MRFGVGFAAAALLSLSGCYTSKQDLIGDHASKITAMDAIIHAKGTSYYSIIEGDHLKLCPLYTRADLTGPCRSTVSAKLERTATGNYIVQVLSGQTYYYALWTRSGPPVSKDCILWLGDGIVGDVKMSPTYIQWSDSEVFASLYRKVRQLATEPPVDRAQLLKIAAQYESQIANPLIERWPCIGEHIGNSDKQVVIVGDNRHLREFDPPAN